jgi:hypothetical protein
MGFQQATGDGNVQILVKDSTHVYVEIGGERAVSLWVPPFREKLPEGESRDLALLLATTTLTDLVGRQPLWDETLAWCTDAEQGPISVVCLAGRGGSGKTRFALELVHHLRGLERWDARFVRFVKSEPFDLWAKTHGEGNDVLLVFDYAPDNAAAIAGSLRLWAETPPKKPKRRLRILRLARTASWGPGWLTQFDSLGTLDFSTSPRGLFRQSRPIVELEPLSREERILVFRQAYERASHHLQLPMHAVDERAFEGERAEETLQDPLTLLMAAVVGLRSGVPQALSLTRVGLAHQAADLLVTRRIETAFPENDALALHLAAYATLSIGLTRDEALEALDVEAGAYHLGAAANPSRLIHRMAAWFPGKEGDLFGAIEPDIVGEAFVLGQLSQRREHGTDAVLRASSARADKVAKFLVRAAQDFSDLEGGSRPEPLQWLEALVAKGEVDDFGLLMEIGDAMPEWSVALRPLELRVRGRILERFHGLVEAAPEEEENWIWTRSRLGWAFDRFSISLGERAGGG